MPSSYGTKVTDPNATLQESTGPVASDSLAAESTRTGGGFSENPDSEPLDSTSTSTHTNTSGTSKLEPAPDARSRSDNQPGEYKQSKALAVEDTTGSYETGGGTSSAGTAPSYVNIVTAEKGGKPKGKNLTEGGFESYDGKNGSFNGDIGGKDDPGREAEFEFERRNAQRDVL